MQWDSGKLITSLGKNRRERQLTTPAIPAILLRGRVPLPVGRAGFKPVGGRAGVFGRFDSCLFRPSGCPQPSHKILKNAENREPQASGRGGRVQEGLLQAIKGMAIKDRGSWRSGRPHAETQLPETEAEIARLGADRDQLVASRPTAVLRKMQDDADLTARIQSLR